jgi:5-methylcytosine-specific restriction endonuclease McrA
VEGKLKVCRHCGTEKPVSEFYKDKSRTDGYARICKACNQKRNKAMYAANPEASKASYRAWRIANAERARAADREKYQKNKKRRNAQSRAWAVAHPERTQEIARRSAEVNRFRVREQRIRSEARRRAAKRGASAVPFSAEELASRIAFYGGICWICRVAPWEHIDHVKPLDKGGPHMLANLRPACGPCNISKNAQWPFSPPPSASGFASAA